MMRGKGEGNFLLLFLLGGGGCLWGGGGFWVFSPPTPPPPPPPRPLLSSLKDFRVYRIPVQGSGGAAGC